MTHMSELRRGRFARKRGNRARLPATASVARTLHDALAVVVRVLTGPVLPLAALAGGCVLPPSLSVGTDDAGVDSPPAIISVRSDQQELPQPGPLLFNQGGGTLDLTLLDTDVGDTLYVSIFVDYDDPVLGEGPDPTPPRSQCVGAASNTPIRTAECDLTGLCESDDVGVTRSMEIVVFDRQPLNTGTPLYQAIPAGGESTNRFYYLQCQPSGS
jgi:hypothetical protein